MTRLGRPMPRWLRTAVAARLGVRAAEEMTYLVSRGIFPMRSTFVVERTGLVKAGQAVFAPPPAVAGRPSGPEADSAGAGFDAAMVLVGHRDGGKPGGGGVSSEQAATVSCRAGWLRLIANRQSPPPAGTARAMAGLGVIASMVTPKSTTRNGYRALQPARGVPLPQNAPASAQDHP